MKRILKGVIKWTLRIVLLVLVLAFFVVFVAYWRSTNDCEQITNVRGTPMKAILKCDYGSPDVLQLKDIDKPTPNDDQLLVRVRATAVNPLDGHMLRGMPIARLMGNGLRKPKDTRSGVDYSGVVEAVGKNAAAAGQFKVGDEVFGGRGGAFAEYICPRADRAVVLKPANLSFEQAAAIPVAAITALQGLRDIGHLQAGQKVLINGASGGVGTFAVQIAKALGAEVTGVCSTRNVDLVRSVGADHVIDYTKEDVTKRAERYDLLFDNVNNHSVSERRRILKPNGICVLAGIGGAGPNQGQMWRIARGFGAALCSRFTDHKFERYGTTFNQADLKFLSELMEQGKLKPFVEKTYYLSEAAEALRYFNEGHARGKLVIVIE